EHGDELGLAVGEVLRGGVVVAPGDGDPHLHARVPVLLPHLGGICGDVPHQRRLDVAHGGVLPGCRGFPPASAPCRLTSLSPPGPARSSASSIMWTSGWCGGRSRCCRKS